jgi:hypothetical protein
VVRRLACAFGTGVGAPTTRPRVGAATTLAFGGLSARLIQLADRWASDAIMVYIRDNIGVFGPGVGGCRLAPRPWRAA